MIDAGKNQSNAGGRDHRPRLHPISICFRRGLIRRGAAQGGRELLKNPGLHRLTICSGGGADSRARFLFRPDRYGVPGFIPFFACSFMSFRNGQKQNPPSRL